MDGGLCRQKKLHYLLEYEQYKVLGLQKLTVINKIQSTSRCSYNDRSMSSRFRKQIHLNKQIHKGKSILEALLRPTVVLFGALEKGVFSRC